MGSLDTDQSTTASAGKASRVWDRVPNLHELGGRGPDGLGEAPWAGCPPSLEMRGNPN
jgi:hypothetical protein